MYFDSYVDFKMYLKHLNLPGFIFDWFGSKRSFHNKVIRSCLKFDLDINELLVSVIFEILKCMELEDDEKHQIMGSILFQFENMKNKLDIFKMDKFFKIEYSKRIEKLKTGYESLIQQVRHQCDLLNKREEALIQREETLDSVVDHNKALLVEIQSLKKHVELLEKENSMYQEEIITYKNSVQQLCGEISQQQTASSSSAIVLVKEDLMPCFQELQDKIENDREVQSTLKEVQIKLTSELSSKKKYLNKLERDIKKEKDSKVELSSNYKKLEAKFSQAKKSYDDNKKNYLQQIDSKNKEIESLKNNQKSSKSSGWEFVDLRSLPVVPGKQKGQIAVALSIDYNDLRKYVRALEYQLYLYGYTLEHIVDKELVSIEILDKLYQLDCPNRRVELRKTWYWEIITEGYSILNNLEFINSLSDDFSKKENYPVKDRSKYYY